MQNHKTLVVRSKELFAYSIGCTEKKWCSVAEKNLIKNDRLACCQEIKRAYNTITLSSDLKGTL